MEAKFQSFGVAHDMTKTQRDECQEKVAEARDKTQNESGDYIYTVSYTHLTLPTKRIV